MDTTLLKELIGIDSVSKKKWSNEHFNNEKEINDYLLAYLQKKYSSRLNYIIDKIRPDWSYNLIVSNSSEPDLLLAWHMDTVPLTDNLLTDNQEHKHHKLIPREENWRIYWRWSVDMKWWVAINVELIDFLLENNIKFRNLFYCDEESGTFLWMNQFVKKYAWKIDPKLSIVTEPTDCEIRYSIRWVAAFEIEILWKTWHSSSKDNWKNAIDESTEFVKAMENFMISRDDENLKSLVNSAWIEWWMKQEVIDKKSKFIITKRDNMIADYCKLLFWVRIGNDVWKQEFMNFAREYLQNKWFEIGKFDCKMWYSALVQPHVVEKYKEFAKVTSWANFGFSDITLLKEKFNWDFLLIWPWPRSNAHKDDEYVDINSLDKATEIIKNIVLWILK